MSNLENKIEAVLFYKNEPFKIKELSKILGINEKETKEILGNLSRSLAGRGICLVMTEDEAGLATAPEIKDFIEKIAKDEMRKEIGRAGLETLAIILYNEPVSRREIDYIRGVNSTFVLRNLCLRGLVEREPDLNDQRIFRYRSSLSLLAHLGLKNKDELPAIEFFKKELAKRNEELS